MEKKNILLLPRETIYDCLKNICQEAGKNSKDDRHWYYTYQSDELPSSKSIISFTYYTKGSRNKFSKSCAISREGDACDFLKRLRNEFTHFFDEGFCKKEDLEALYNAILKQITLEAEQKFNKIINECKIFCDAINK